jgi:hypothetical protein
MQRAIRESSREIHLTDAFYLIDRVIALGHFDACESLIS